VPDDFTIKLDTDFYGPFHLKPKVAAKSELTNDKTRPRDITYKPGCILYDAFYISENLKTQSNYDKIQLILKEYDINNENLKENYFLNDTIKGVYSQGEVHGVGTLSKANLSSIGGLDVTNIADGFAKFIVKRTKQELSITFFDQFKEKLKTYPDLQTIFPSTTKILEAVDQEIYDYSNYLNNMREAFRSDLQVLDENLPSIINNHEDLFKRKNYFELAVALKTSCYISSSLKHDKHPGDILDNYPTSYFDDAPIEATPRLDVLKGSIQLLQLISESMRESDTTKHNYWVSIDKVRELVNDKQALKIYFGLFIQQAHKKYDNIKFNDSTNLYCILNDSNVVKNFNNDYSAYKQYFLNFGTKINELNAMVKQYSKPTNDSIKIELYAKYFKTSLQFIEYCTQVNELPHLKEIPSIKDLGEKTKIYFDIAYETINLTTAINRKRYPEAINHLIIIYDEVVKQPQFTEETDKSLKEGKTKKKELTKNTTPAVNEDKSGNNAPIGHALNSKTVVNNKGDNHNKVNQTLGLILKYGAFMSNMVNASTSDEVEAAIESVALPSGSARIKRETNFNVSLNAYCGFFTGHEEEKFSFKNGGLLNSYGITVPIGLALSWGHSLLPGTHWMNGGASSTVFFSFFDIGAIATFRFVDDTTKTLSKIELKDIISPGIFLSWGIPKTPISLNLGYQITPYLREVSTSNNTFKSSYSRFSVSVCVDLPLLNCYSKPR
jgi:hypothetical protein